MPNTNEYIEIIAMMIANGVNISVDLNNEQIKYIAENLDYYSGYGNLLINNLSWNIPILSQSLRYMTENRLGHNLSFEIVLPKFIEITNNIGVSKSVLLEQLNDWEIDKETIGSNIIQEILPDAQFFQFSKITKNDLTDYLNNTIIEALSIIQSDQLYTFLQQPNLYWTIVVENLIDTDFLKQLPENLTEVGKKYLDDIAASRTSIPLEDSIPHKLIEKLDRRKTKETITHIRNQICNNVSGYNINTEKFIFLHKWLEQQGELSLRPGDVCQYILNPIANNDTCIQIILQNADFYANIVNSSSSQADTFKNVINIKLSNTTDENLVSFAKAIGVEIEKKK